MKPCIAIASLCLCLFAVPCCKSTGKIVATPAYLQADSPADPPGMRAARAAERAKRVKDGAYKPGEQLDVQGGKVYVFRRNPDIDKETSGGMVSAEKATIVVCEGMYYYVELDDGSKGYIRETDLVNPLRLVQKGLMPELGPDGMPLPGGGVLFPEETAVQGQPIELDQNQKLMTNSAGRTVVVSTKTTEKGDAFEARKRAMMGEGADQPQGKDAALPEPKPEQDAGQPPLPSPDDIPDLPESNAAPAM